MVPVAFREQTPLSARPLIMKWRNLAGSTIGGSRETQEMLDFCTRHDATAHVEAIRIQEIDKA